MKLYLFFLLSLNRQNVNIQVFITLLSLLSFQLTSDGCRIITDEAMKLAIASNERGLRQMIDLMDVDPDHMRPPAPSEIGIALLSGGESIRR